MALGCSQREGVSVKGRGVEHKVDAKCRIGRDWECHRKFVAENPGLPLTEMDSVEGTKGGKVLPTLMFMPYCFMPTSFDALTQDDVDLMMSHINSYVRGASGDKPPCDLMTGKLGVEFADLFNIRRIPANDVVLKPSLLGIEQKVRPEILKATDPKNNTK